MRASNTERCYDDVACELALAGVLYIRMYRYTVQSLTTDIKSLKDNVNQVTQQLSSVTHDTFRQKLKTFIKVRAIDVLASLSVLVSLHS